MTFILVPRCQKYDDNKTALLGAADSSCSLIAIRSLTHLPGYF